MEEEMDNNSTLKGKKLYQERARRALPILVRQAKAGVHIYYSDLSIELNMKNPRNLNCVLGAIGSELLELGKKWKLNIPPLQSLVFNRHNQMPGEGIILFIHNPEEYKNATRKRKRILIDQMLLEVYKFDQWDKVLRELGLEPLKGNAKIPQTSILSGVPDNKNYFGGGESDAHRELKEFILQNPTCLGLSFKKLEGKMEFSFLSGDTIDILFCQRKSWVGVEVKSHHSNQDDIRRGLFQCVKYQALIKASQTVSGLYPDCRVILALGGPFPKELLPEKHQLGIEVKDNLFKGTGQ